MSAFTMLAKRFIDNGVLYIENGVPVLFSDVSTDSVRRATLRDLSIIVPAWPVIVNRILGGRQ